MSANSFGSRFVITSFGESHGPALGVVVDGCPAGVEWDEELLRSELARRRPGTTESSGAQLVSGRDEGDAPEVLSGVHEQKTLGTPIAIVVRNRDARPGDYAGIAVSPRPGHADDVWQGKFGHRDPRGGGRTSGRETIARVMAGAVARMLLRSCSPATAVKGFARAIGPLELTQEELEGVARIGAGASGLDRFSARFPSERGSRDAEALLLAAKKDGRSYGGVAEIWVDAPPAGLGQPVFHKLKADLASAILGVGATSAVEIGDGALAAAREGSEFHRPGTEGSRYGGIRGGISTGERIVVRASFKPTSSVLDVAKQGRHDPCIVPRAIPVLEAMTWIVLADHLLWARGDRADRIN